MNIVIVWMLAILAGLFFLGVFLAIIRNDGDETEAEELFFFLWITGFFDNDKNNDEY